MNTAWPILCIFRISILQFINTMNYSLYNRDGNFLVVNLVYSVTTMFNITGFKISKLFVVTKSKYFEGFLTQTVNSIYWSTSFETKSSWWQQCRINTVYLRCGQEFFFLEIINCSLSSFFSLILNKHIHVIKLCYYDTDNIEKIYLSHFL